MSAELEQVFLTMELIDIEQSCRLKVDQRGAGEPVEVETGEFRTRVQAPRRLRQEAPVSTVHGPIGRASSSRLSSSPLPGGATEPDRRSGRSLALTTRPVGRISWRCTSGYARRSAWGTLPRGFLQPRGQAGIFLLKRSTTPPQPPPPPSPSTVGHLS